MQFSARGLIRSAIFVTKTEFLSCFSFERVCGVFHQKSDRYHFAPKTRPEKVFLALKSGFCALESIFRLHYSNFSAQKNQILVREKTRRKIQRVIFDIKIVE